MRETDANYTRRGLLASAIATASVAIGYLMFVAANATVRSPSLSLCLAITVMISLWFMGHAIQQQRRGQLNTIHIAAILLPITWIILDPPLSHSFEKYAICLILNWRLVACLVKNHEPRQALITSAMISIATYLMFSSAFHPFGWGVGFTGSWVR